MTHRKEIAGGVVQYEHPRWTPLETLVSTKLAGWFMWMHEVELDDGTAVHAYKHQATRRYFHLATDGRAFAYTAAGNYLQISLSAARDAA